MIHTMTVRSNPRLILLGLLLIALPLFGLILLFTITGIGGIIGLLASGFITYQVAKFMIPQVRTRIETDEGGIMCSRPDSDTVDFRWSEVTHAGFVRQKSEKPSIFLYNEKEDRLTIIPQEFSDFDQLLARVKQQTPFQEIRLDATDSIHGWLRRHLNITADAAATDDAEAAQT